MTFRRAGPPCRTPKCHSYCSFNTECGISRIVLSCISAAKVIILKMARHAARLNVILTAVLIQTVESRESIAYVFIHMVIATIYIVLVTQ